MVAERPLTRGAIALCLGAAGYLLNQTSLHLLTGETPPFVFGGIAIVVAFIWLGRPLGVFVGLLTLADSLARADAVGFGTLIYIAEAWFITATFRQTGSLVLNAIAFWLLVGWVWDLVVFGAVVGVQRDYLLLLYVRQVLGGALNALVVDVAAHVASVTRWPALHVTAQPTSLYEFARRRVLVAVMCLVVVLGFVLSRTAFEQVLNVEALRQQRSATTGNAALRGFIEERSTALGWLAGELALLHGRGEAWDQAVVDDFHARHHDFLNVGVVRADGLVLLMSPATGATGQPLAGHSLAERQYFKEARDTGRAVFAPLILGTLHVRDASNDEPIVVIAHPIRGPAGAFLGLALGAVPSASLRDILWRQRTRPEEVSTLVDGDGRVIATLDARLTVGAAVTDFIDPAVLEAPEAWTGFRFYPPADASLESRLAMNLDLAVFQRVAPSRWGILVSFPADRLHAAMVPVVSWTLLGLLIAMALAHWVSASLARTVSAPLVAVSDAAHAFANREFDEPRTWGTDTVAVEEVVRLRDDMSALASALRHYRALTDERQAAIEERFRAIFAQAAIGIGIVGPDGRFEMVNDRLCQVLGRSREALVGAGADTFVADEDAPRVRDDYDAIRQGREAMLAAERRFVLPGGSLVWALETVSAVRTGEGATRYFISIVEDLTERKHLEATVLHAQKMESLGRLAGGIAHDFNNLMTAVLGYSDLVRDSLELADPRRADVLEIRRAAERAAALTARLLAFARRQVVESRVIDLNLVVHRTERMLRRLLDEDVMLSIHTVEPVWPVRADESQIEQVLMNLVVNARDATGSGGEIAIRTGTVAGGRLGDLVTDVVELSVSDTGPGLSDEARAHLFEPFFTTKGRDKGTGLGLATCFGIVTQAGGEIVVESTPGHGATFTVRLPRVHDVAVAEVVEAVRPRITAHETILLVEDEASVAALAATALTRQGYALLRARDGVEAIEVAAAHHGTIDLLLTDLVMPRMGGVDLAATLGPLRPGLRILFMSGYAADTFETGRELPPGIPLLAKPFSVAALCDAVRRVLRPAGPDAEPPTA